MVNSIRGSGVGKGFYDYDVTTPIEPAPNITSLLYGVGYIYNGGFRWLSAAIVSVISFKYVYFDKSISIHLT